MALSTEAKAYNTAILNAITKLGLYYESLTAGDVVQITPIDIGQDSAYDKSQQTDTVGDMTTAGTGVMPSFSTVFSMAMVNDGEFPISLPIKLPDAVTPLFWAVTNQAHDLDVT